MMKEEFEKLAGMSVTYTEYKEIEEAYMKAPEMQPKIEFVRLWKDDLGPETLAARRLQELVQIDNEREIIKAELNSVKVEYEKLVAKHETLYLRMQATEKKYLKDMKLVQQARNILFNVD
ncbi:MAG: hypothetical protein LBQ88_07195 [Treponema sp.]|jgi:hypothetical protein|nr:hypothetical protein [Treponema sp.]